MLMRSTAMLTVLIAALAACDAPSALGPLEPGENARAAGPSLSVSTCAQDTIPATRLGGVPADPGIIAGNCTREACGDLGAQGVRINVDATTSLLDEAVIWCPNKGLTTTMLSSEVCWDCMNNCAGSACPLGATCSPIPGSPGSDCQAFSCPAGYDMRYTSVLREPVCVSKCPPATPLSVSISGPMEIYPGTQCTWTAFPTGGSGSYTYSWYSAGTLVGTGVSYTGGRPRYAGTSQWQLRVVVSDGSTSASAEMTVRESTRARFCPT